MEKKTSAITEGTIYLRTTAKTKLLALLGERPTEDRRRGLWGKTADASLRQNFTQRSRPREQKAVN